MNVPRYVIAGGASIALHAALLFVAQESKVFAMPAGSQSNSVSINFVSSAPAIESTSQSEPEPVQPEPIVEKKPTPEPPAQQEVAPPVKAKSVKHAPLPPKSAVKPKQKARPKPERPKTQKPEPKKKELEPKPEAKKKEPTETVKKPSQVAQRQAPPKEVNQGVSSTPVLVNKPSFAARPSPPRYPRIARKRGIQGVATYEIWLDESGNQTKQALVSSSGALMLDKAALDAIKKWKFSAHTVNGKAIAHRIQIPVRFKLD
ncbi:TonB family protein [Vibrio profundi]|uniref:energy transducer TonB n=1 Tax=Vibrio profundi TaxID=1774960 RepID=UPI003736AFB9